MEEFLEDDDDDDCIVTGPECPECGFNQYEEYYAGRYFCIGCHREVYIPNVSCEFKLNQDRTVIHGVSEVIKEDSIVWIKSSDRTIHCGRVDKVYTDTNEVLVFNFDAWTHWTVSYNNIVRVGVSFFSDEYREWMSR